MARVWWDTTQPGAGDSQLENPADSAPDPDEDSGITGRAAEEPWVICARSGFPFPLSETAIDPNTGARVGIRFLDPPAPIVDGEPG